MSALRWFGLRRALANVGVALLFVVGFASLLALLVMLAGCGATMNKERPGVTWEYRSRP